MTITDAMITVYDLHTHEILCQLSETRGCNLFTTQERNCTLVVVNKKKVSYYIWQGTSFDHLTDRSLTDTPKLLHCLSHSLIVGYRRYYESVDIPPITATLLGPNALGSIGTPRPDPLSLHAFLYSSTQSSIHFYIHLFIYSSIHAF